MRESTAIGLLLVELQKSRRSQEQFQRDVLARMDEALMMLRNSQAPLGWKIGAANEDVLGH